MHGTRHLYRDRIGLAGLLLAIGVMPLAHAQSFDCRKVSTGIEDAICSNGVLGHLDESLQRAFADAISRAPDDRADITRSQRHWLTARNQTCAQSVTDSRAALVRCVARMYTDRIRELEAIPARPQIEPAAVESCHKLETRYRAIADAHPGASPLDVLARESGSILLC